MAQRLNEFASLVSLLTDFDKSGEQSVTGSAQVGSLGSVEKRLLLLPLVKPQPRDGGWLKTLQRPTNMDLIGMYYSNLGCL